MVSRGHRSGKLIAGTLATYRIELLRRVAQLRACRRRSLSCLASLARRTSSSAMARSETFRRADRWRSAVAKISHHRTALVSVVVAHGQSLAPTTYRHNINRP